MFTGDKHVGVGYVVELPELSILSSDSSLTAETKDDDDDKDDERERGAQAMLFFDVCSGR